MQTSQCHVQNSFSQRASQSHTDRSCDELPERRQARDIVPIRMGWVNSDRREADTDTTTEALDYGEIALDHDRKARLFGTPGQERFAFLRRNLARRVLGEIVPIDNSRPDPLGDLISQLGSFADLIWAGRLVAGISHTDTHPEPSIDRYAASLGSVQSLMPLIRVDVRYRGDVPLLLNVLPCQIDANEDSQ